MKKRLLTLFLAGVMVFSLAACGKKEEKETGVASTENTKTESTAESTTETIKVLYGTNHYENYEAMINCPKGAYFDESDVKEYKEEGDVLSLSVYDDIREYTAYTTDYHSLESYDNMPGNEYGIAERLYFYGELDADYAAQYESYSQEITNLGFQWEGKDVILVETKYTYPEYSEQIDVFVGVEYDLDFWKAKEEGGIEEHLTAPGLFGFTMYSTGWEDLTQAQCAWIAGQLFGVDSGRTWELEGESEGVEEAEVIAVNVDDILGTWLEPDSSWENTYTFNADGTGFLVSGPEYPFTYKISGSTLTLIYEEDDTEDFEIVVDGNSMIMIDQWGEEHKLERTADAVQSEDSGLEAKIIATWKDMESKFQETFTFRADETGLYSYEENGTHFEYEFTYWITSDNVINITYEDGDHATFYVQIEGNSLIFDKDWILTRQ